MSPRGEEHNRQLRERSRQRLLTAALELFSEQGFAATTVAEIASRAGLSKGLAYNYFESKEQLLDEILTERWQRSEERQRRAEAIADPVARLRFLVGDALDSALRHPEEQRLFLRAALQPRSAEALMAAKLRVRPQLESWQRRMTELFRQLGIADPEAETSFFVSMLNGLVLTVLSAPSSGGAGAEAQRRALVESLVERAVAAYRPRRAGEPAPGEE